tara:strand:+ start:82 stop:264 length:183 start_codon:yes stop_codon:yes gene_type:complete
MVSFARARTRSLLSKIWPVAQKPLNNQTAESSNSKKRLEDVVSQNKRFLEASKNGGMWFS